MHGTDRGLRATSLRRVLWTLPSSGLDGPAEVALPRVALPLLGLAFLTTWVYGSYYGGRPAELLSGPLNDGWCATGAAVFGHCFGDYALVNRLFGGPGDPWTNPSMGLWMSWPAVAWMPALAARSLALATNLPQLGPLAFTLAAALCLLAPAVWLTARHQAARDWVGTVLAAGAGTTAFVATIDRGNPVAFTVPLLLCAALAFTGRSWTVFAVAVALASLVKPQLIVLLVLLVAQRRPRQALLGGAVAAGGTVLGFASFSPYFPANLLGWLDAVSRRTGDYQPLDAAFPYNLGIGRGLLTILDGLGLRLWAGPEARAAVVSALSTANTWCIAVVLALSVVAVWVARDRLDGLHAFTLVVVAAIFTSGTVYLYYTAFLLPSLALSIAEAAAGRSRFARHSSWMLLVIVAPVLVPVPEAWFTATVTMDRVSLWQLLVGPALLAYWGWLVAGAWRSRARRTPPFAQESPSTRDDELLVNSGRLLGSSA